MFASSSKPVNSITKSIGYSKSKTYKFEKYKEEIASKKSRFKKKVTNSPFQNTNNSGTETFLARRHSDAYIELGTNNRPAWKDLHDDCETKFNTIMEAYRELQKLSAKRIKISFGDHKSVDQEIRMKNDQISDLLIACEGNLSKINKQGLGSKETEGEKKIRKNIESALAQKIQELTFLVRRQQKALMDRLSNLSSATPIPDYAYVTSEDMNEEEMKEMEVMEDMARGRDEDINRLVDSINKLSRLFKQMNELVIEQGSIIDRIDYNLESAEVHVSKGKQQLIKAKANLNSPCATNCIRSLQILIVVFSVLLVIKFWHHDD